MNFSVTKYGEPLDSHLYNWDERTRTFSTNENYLVLNFKGIHGITFNTYHNCEFITGSKCTFITKSGCTFKTESWCTFNTEHSCTFTTGPYCTFDTGHNCEFKTRDRCVIIRRDKFEVIKLEKNFNHIILNDWLTSGYTEIPPKVDKELNDFYFTKKDFEIK